MTKERDFYTPDELVNKNTIRLGDDVVAYFKNMAAEMDVPYQKLMNMYLRDCVQSHRKVEWIAH